MATAAGLARPSAPPDTAVATAVMFTSCTSTRCPAPSSRRTIGAPMAPRPDEPKGLCACGSGAAHGFTSGQAGSSGLKACAAGTVASTL